jgi:hypothetical protein
MQRTMWPRSSTSHLCSEQSPGKPAGIILLAEDIFAIDPMHIPTRISARMQDVKVDSTYLGGEPIHQREAH